MYADDVTLLYYSQIHNVMSFRQFEKHIQQIKNLLKTLKLRISYDKSTIVIFAKNNIPLNLRHNRLTNVEISNNVKYLGVHIILTAI